MLPVYYFRESDADNIFMSKIFVSLNAPYLCYTNNSIINESSISCVRKCVLKVITIHPDMRILIITILLV